MHVAEHHVNMMPTVPEGLDLETEKNFARVLPLVPPHDHCLPAQGMMLWVSCVQWCEVLTGLC